MAQGVNTTMLPSRLRDSVRAAPKLEPMPTPLPSPTLAPPPNDAVPMREEVVVLHTTPPGMPALKTLEETPPSPQEADNASDLVLVQLDEPPPPPADLESLSARELKSIASSMGLPTHGRKLEIAARITQSRAQSSDAPVTE